MSTSPFPLLSTPLISLTEAQRICPGFLEECGDEVDAGRKLCDTHQREQDDHYQRKIWEADGHEALAVYPHLMD